MRRTTFLAKLKKPGASRAMQAVIHPGDAGFRPLNLRQKHQVSRIVNRKFEKKYHIDGVDFLPGTSWVFDRMTDVPQSTTASTDITRIGDLITLKNLRIRISIFPNPLNVIRYRYVRVVIFQWKPNSALAAPVATALFQTDPVPGTITYNSFWGRDTRTQYKVLFDRTFILSGDTTAGYTESLVRQVNTFVPMRKMIKDLRFSASGLEAANHLYIGTIADTSVGGPTVKCAWYIDFTDA